MSTMPIKKKQKQPTKTKHLRRSNRLRNVEEDEAKGLRLSKKKIMNELTTYRSALVAWLKKDTGVIEKSIEDLLADTLDHNSHPLYPTERKSNVPNEDIHNNISFTSQPTKPPLHNPAATNIDGHILEPDFLKELEQFMESQEVDQVDAENKRKEEVEKLIARYNNEMLRVLQRHSLERLDEKKARSKNIQQFIRRHMEGATSRPNSISNGKDANRFYDSRSENHVPKPNPQHIASVVSSMVEDDYARAATYSYSKEGVLSTTKSPTNQEELVSGKSNTSLDLVDLLRQSSCYNMSAEQTTGIAATSIGDPSKARDGMNTRGLFNGRGAQANNEAGTSQETNKQSSLQANIQNSIEIGSNFKEKNGTTDRTYSLEPAWDSFFVAPKQRTSNLNGVFRTNHPHHGSMSTIHSTFSKYATHKNQLNAFQSLAQRENLVDLFKSESKEWNSEMGGSLNKTPANIVDGDVCKSDDDFNSVSPNHESKPKIRTKLKKLFSYEFDMMSEDSSGKSDDESNYEISGESDDEMGDESNYENELAPSTSESDYSVGEESADNDTGIEAESNIQNNVY
ncbi:hypothetical protein CORT_0B00100 [Candida orthopsilosis Co 90-125]|uniref:Uncharacterized protein n=1 Tax=Candida orthopsilosis (strain 90-125) TaxID=1136231 RepID=H8WZ65_CANO9|nr:hypothetical protein CORT_0B00100 [Candida orthopsilosis Co 90-125]CCG21733.1 hypothetical protein CORT_0B00100 [Candida orthopsilosis Co 90-125]